MRRSEANPADVEEQQQPVLQRMPAETPEIPLEAPEADVIEQAQSVPLDEEERR